MSYMTVVTVADRPTDRPTLQSFIVRPPPPSAVTRRTHSLYPDRLKLNVRTAPCRAARPRAVDGRAERIAVRPSDDDDVAGGGGGGGGSIAKHASSP